MNFDRAMVTGGCGFVGSAVASRLAAEGVEVVVLDDQRLGTPANVSAWGSLDNISFAVGNLEDPDLTRRVVAQHSPQVIFHLAAMHFIPDCNRDPHRAVSVNVAGTQSLLDACRELEELTTLIVTSSAAVYAPSSVAHREDEEPGPTDIYGLTKLWNEQQATAFHEARGGSTGVGIARLFNVFGPGETNEHLIPAILKQAQAGDRLSLGNLDSRRDYVYVTDVADAFAKFPDAVSGGALKTCNVGTGRQYDGHEVVAAVASLLERELEVDLDPKRLRPSDRPDLLSDTSRAESVLGWRAGTGLQEGLRQAATRPLTRP